MLDLIIFTETWNSNHEEYIALERHKFLLFINNQNTTTKIIYPTKNIIFLEKLKKFNQLFQKFKHSHLIIRVQQMGNFKIDGRAEKRFELRTTCSDTMINYHLSQKLNPLRKCEFNHLTIILTKIETWIPS